MATFRSSVLIAAGLLLLGAGAAAARPCGGVAADHALAEATLVVKGSLVSTDPPGAPEGDSSSVIHVDRILKGTTTRPEIAVTHFLCGLEYRLAMRKGRPMIVFVSASGSLVNGTAVLPASSRSAAEDSADPKSNLRNELHLAAVDDDPNTARAAVGALAELDGRASIPTLQQAASRHDLGTRVRALAWLTRFGDADAFDRLAGILSAPPFTPPGIPTMIRNDQDAALAIAHQDVMLALSSFGERDFHVSTAPRAAASRFVEITMGIARSPDALIRRVAFDALRGFKDPATFSFLADALNDPDQHIRFNAMFTLCMAMNAPDLPCPSVPLFEQDEQKYIGRVRAWGKSQF